MNTNPHPTANQILMKSVNTRNNYDDQAVILNLFNKSTSITVHTSVVELGIHLLIKETQRPQSEAISTAHVRQYDPRSVALRAVLTWAIFMTSDYPEVFLIFTTRYNA